MEFKKRNSKLFLISGQARSGKNEVAKIIEKYYGNKKTITISFGHYIKDYAKRVSDWDGNENTKPRALLQELGIELIKNRINNKLFINRILEDIEIFSYFYDIIVVNDVRLLDELEILKEKYPDSISIRVLRDNFDNGLTLEQKEHLTETNLNNYTNFDYIVKNDKILNEKIKNILNEV